ncbi:MAG: NAD(P)H-binding protein [Cyclobacteriaceae bacterium]|nr:NAD(P)H-binding protein [Cyclobacteriaceae bacterium]
MTRTALIAGSTGLIGNQLLPLLLDSTEYDRVIALSRKPLQLNHARLENVIITVDRLDQLANLKADDIYCCLGTTIGQAKSKEAFRKVDYEYPVELARNLKKNGAQQFLLVSALGANKYSRIFYNRVKGEVEEAIEHVGFSTFHIFRPSLLVGDRKEERRGEEAAKIFYKFFGFLIPKKYKEIESIKVALAMLAQAKNKSSGLIIHESDSLQNY